MLQLCKKCVATFRAILGEIGQLFIPSSSHTGRDAPRFIHFSAIAIADASPNARKLWAWACR